MLRYLFAPDMLLRSLRAAEKALADKSLFEGDLLSRVGLIEEVAVRSFHGEVRKLEEALKALPDGHEERKKIEQRLLVAKKYRQSAIQLYLDSMKKQKALIEDWQRETKKAEPAGAGQRATHSKDESPVKDQSSTQPPKDGRR